MIFVRDRQCCAPLHKVNLVYFFVSENVFELPHSHILCWNVQKEFRINEHCLKFDENKSFKTVYMPVPFAKFSKISASGRYADRSIW